MANTFMQDYISEQKLSTWIKQHHSSDYKVLLFLKRVMIGHLKIFANIYHCATYYSMTDILPSTLTRLRTNTASNLCMPTNYY